MKLLLRLFLWGTLAVAGLIYWRQPHQPAPALTTVAATNTVEHPGLRPTERVEWRKWAKEIESNLRAIVSTNHNTNPKP